MELWFGPRPRAAAVGGLLALTLLSLSAPFADAKGPGNDPAGIITRMEDVYKNAKSYQGTISMKQSGKTPDGKPFSMSESRQVRFKAPNQIFDQQQVSGTGAAVKISNRSQTWVGDGKSLYVYVPAQKMYAKRAAPPTIALTQILARYLPHAPQFSLTMAAAAKVNGRDALVISAKPKVPASFPASITKEQKAQILERIKKQRPTQIYIDKQNYQLLRLVGGPQDRTDEITFVSQQFNGAVPESAFTFHPPAGAKLFVPPAPGSARPGNGVAGGKQAGNGAAGGIGPLSRAMTTEIQRYYLARHGVTDWNKAMRFQGHADIPLDAEGRQQAQKLGARLAALSAPPVAVYSSDLSRARDTAEAIAAPLGLTVVATPDLRETFLGAWEGLSRAEIEARGEGALLAAYQQDSLVNRPPNSEPLEAVWERMNRAWNEIRATKPGGPVAIVGHGGSLRTLICAALAAPISSMQRLWLDNASLSILEEGVGSEDDRKRIVLLNDTCHLF